MDGLELFDAERPAVGGTIQYEASDGIGSFYGSKNWRDIDAKRLADMRKRLQQLGLPMPLPAAGAAVAVPQRPLLPLTPAMTAATRPVYAIGPWAVLRPGQGATGYGGWQVASRKGFGDLGSFSTFRDRMAALRAMAAKAAAEKKAKAAKAKAKSKAVTVSNRFNYRGTVFALDAATATWRMVSAPKALSAAPELKREFATQVEAKAAVDAVLATPAATASATTTATAAAVPAAPSWSPIVVSTLPAAGAAPAAAAVEYKGFTITPRQVGYATKWYITNNVGQVRVTTAISPGPYDSAAAAQTAVDLSTQTTAGYQQPYQTPYLPQQYQQQYQAPMSMSSAAQFSDSYYGDEAAATDEYGGSSTYGDDYGGGSSDAYSDDGYGAAEGDDATYNEGGAYGMGDLGWGMPNIGGKISRVIKKASSGASTKLSKGAEKVEKKANEMGDKISKSMKEPDQTIQEDDTFIPGEQMKGSKLPWIIGGSVLGVAIIGTVIALVLAKKRKR